MARDGAGRVALVTGAAGDIGRAISIALAGEGAHVVMADLRPPAEWREAAAGVASAGPRPLAVELDVRSGESCRAAVEAAVGAHGGLDVLVNNAAVNLFKPAAETTAEELMELFDVNAAGAFRMAAAGRRFLARAGGAVVNVASACGQVATAGSAAYCVSKAALIHLTRVLAVEWAPEIRVNAVAPTVVATAMSRPVTESPEYMRAKLASIPLGRIASTGDVAGAVRYLASPAAGMVTGHTLFVDGGLSIA